MADTTISALDSTTSPARTGVIPYSDGSSTTKLTITQIADLIVPIGSIIMWSGSIASIPSNWALCDGTNGTPDLRNQFIIGASIDVNGQSQTGVTGANTKTGGSKDAIVVSHTHTATDSGHSHNFTIGSNSSVAATIPGYGQLGNRSGTTTSGTANITVSTTGSSGTDKNLPPYYALAFIMRVS